MAQRVADRLKQKGSFGRYSLAEVAAHNHKDSAWIAVEGRVRMGAGEASRECRGPPSYVLCSAP